MPWQRSSALYQVWSLLLVSKLLQFGYTLVRAIDVTHALAWIERNVRTDYVEGIREVEPVERLFQDTLRVVDVDCAAARYAGSRLSDEKPLVNGIKFHVSAAVELYGL